MTNCLFVFLTCTFIVVVDSFFHVVTAAATRWTTVISQRPAPATLDRCSRVTLTLSFYTLCTFVWLKCYTCVFFSVLRIFTNKMVTSVRLTRCGTDNFRKPSIDLNKNCLVIRMRKWQLKSRLRAAAMLEIARQERTSVNTSGDQVSLMFTVVSV